MILFLDNYDSFTYNLVDYIGQLEPDLMVVRNDQIDVAEIAALHPRGILISPGPGTPDKAGISSTLIKAFHSRIPIFGVCLGFQAIGQAFGAKVIRAPFPVHGKTSLIYHNGRGIFKNIPSPLEAARYHSLIIERASLPDEFIITAESEDQLIMAIEHKIFPLSGVQFHPESILTLQGKRILRNWLSITKNFHYQNGVGDD
jgi:anthranilate synthase/aminodeoxychorismate synthase-like glutamine amidotransferase